MKDFIELIKYHVKDHPNRIAIIDGKRKINYEDFFNLINSISNKLLEINDKPKIILDLTQSIESYALIIASLNVGGTYCPLYTEAPIERKLQIAREFQPDLIVVETDDNIPTFEKFNVKSLPKLADKKDITSIVKECDPEGIIYVIYTSGSTGMPKGVMICRKALNKFLEWSIPTYSAREGDIWGQFSSLSFDLSIVDIFTCLCSGATLFVIANKASKLIPSAVIEKNKITIWHSVPSAIDFMIERENSKEANFSSLRLMSFCGEPLRKYHLDFLFKKNSKIMVFNTYGPTEGTLFCTWQELRNDNYMEYCQSTMSIGNTIPGWNFTFNPSEDSSEKEIVIYGEYIGVGYLGSVEDTKFRIIEIENNRRHAFETGDLVIEKNGNLYFSCRKDRQIKLKGYRIEPDEIDFWITEHLKNPSVTLLHKDALYSFIETEQTIDSEALNNFLKKKIEAYKIPRAFIPIPKFPRNSNFKINHSELINLIQ